MNNRNSILAIIGLIAVIGVIFGVVYLVDFLTQKISKSPQLEGPNIVLVVSDDQRYGTIDVMPTLSELMSHGTTFTRGYVTTPLCCPSRATILSGLYAHNHGVLNNRPPDGGFDAFNDSSTLPVWLHNAGYQTALMGKYLNGYSDEDAGYVPPGWDRFNAFVDEPGYYAFTLTRKGNGTSDGVTAYTRADNVYSTTLLAEEAAEFIHQATDSSDQPFFLMYTPYAPHGPTTPPDHYSHETATWGKSASYNELDVTDKSTWLQQLPKLLPREEQRITTLKNKTAGVLHALDDGLSTIITALQDAGVADNTVIIYTSDNGFHWGEHRIPNGKATPYEESIHVPFYVYDGRSPTAKSDDRLVLNIDIAPTVAALAGVAAPDNLDGKSWLDTNFKRSQFLSECCGDLSVRPYTAVHTGDLVLIEYANGTQELYSLTNDPDQLNNVIDDPNYSTQKLQLKADLERLKTCKAESCN